MPVTRRSVLVGSAGGAAALAADLARPALAASEPIRIGFLPALTGPTSETGIGIARGTDQAVKDINAAGGVNGRKIELITRDTQSNPSKAVNAASDLIQRQHVVAIWGPCNSGEALATVGLVARLGIPQVHPDFVDSLTNVKKYPFCYRVSPDNQQIAIAVKQYMLDVLKVKKIALIGDTSGYGVSTVNAYGPVLKAAGLDVVYQGTTDPNAPDLKPELLRMRSAGAQAISPWSVNPGFLSRIINTRGEMGWLVPLVGQQSLGSGHTKSLVQNSSYYDKVFNQYFKNCTFDSAGKLSPRTEAYVKHLLANKITISDNLLWLIAVGRDAVYLVADAVKHAGSSAKEISGYWETLKAWPGVSGDFTFTPEDHNGFPQDEAVLCVADSFKDGAFKLAPGYST